MAVAQISELGELIRSHRARFGLTQNRVAEAMNVSRAWIAGIETGKGERRPDPLYVARAANYLRLGRREAFQKAGYTAGEVLELFGSEADQAAEPIDELSAVAAELRQTAEEQRRVTAGLLQALETVACDLARAPS
jgi:transcriptional regulator with XRE-family HTH domain